MSLIVYMFVIVLFVHIYIITIASHTHTWRFTCTSRNCIFTDTPHNRRVSITIASHTDWGFTYTNAPHNRSCVSVGTVRKRGCGGKQKRVGQGDGTGGGGGRGGGEREGGGGVKSRHNASSGRAAAAVDTAAVAANKGTVLPVTVFARAWEPAKAVVGR